MILNPKLLSNPSFKIIGPVGCEDIVIPKGENFGIFACGQDILFKKIWGGSKYTALSKNPLKQEELDKFYHYDLEVNLDFLNILMLLINIIKNY
jgi:hypothetical protein